MTAVSPPECAGSATNLDVLLIQFTSPVAGLQHRQELRKPIRPDNDHIVARGKARRRGRDEGRAEGEADASPDDHPDTKASHGWPFTRRLVVALHEFEPELP